MTPNPDQSNRSQGGTKETAQQESQQVKDKTKDAARDVGDTARTEAGHVKDEAVSQAKGLADSVKDEAASQASTQQSRLAEQSRTVSDDLRRLSEGEKPESQVVTRAVSTVADRADEFTRKLENKEPADLLDDVRRFAARRPGAFLAIAAGVGLVAGRLTRGLRDSQSDGGSGGGQRSPSGADQRRAAGTSAPPPALTPPPGRVPGTVYPDDTAGGTGRAGTTAPTASTPTAPAPPTAPPAGQDPARITEPGGRA